MLEISDIFKLQIGQFVCDCLRKQTPIRFKWFMLNADMHDHETRSRTTVNTRDTTYVITQIICSYYLLELLSMDKNQLKFKDEEFGMGFP